jgi:beta-hydroxylase
MIIASILLLFSLLSMVYVYRFRGRRRYDSVRQYLRKGWPIFTPLNCLLYLFTRPRGRGAIMDLKAYPELRPIRENWKTIRNEALALHCQRVFEQTARPDSAAYYDVGFRTFHKYGWSKFYLHWYGASHVSARRLCPETTRLLNRIPGVQGAMFSVLPAGAMLTPHADPVACSLRYHLGLATSDSSDCYIDIDGHRHEWREGQDLLFDETFIHHARNDSREDRLILMCDVRRPTWLFGPLVNGFYCLLMKTTVVPNLDGDPRGAANRIFAGLAPLLARVRRLKQSAPARYRLLKYSVNSLLVALALGLPAAAIVFAIRLLESA